MAPTRILHQLTLVSLMAGLLAVPMSISVTGGSAVGAESPAINPVLFERAQSYVEFRNSAVVSETAGTGVLSDVPMTEEFSRQATGAWQALAQRRDRLAGKGVRYSAARTTLTPVRMSSDVHEVRLVVHEYTELEFARIVGDEPPFTAYAVDQVLTFERTGAGDWALAASQPVGSGGLAPLTMLDSSALQAGGRVIVAPPDVDVGEVGGVGDLGAPGTSEYDCGEPYACTPDDQVDVSLVLAPSATVGGVPVPAPYKELLAGGAQRAAGPPAGLDYSAMYRYALTHWDNYNPDFRVASNGNDCTNFISQILRTGGWKHDTGWYKSNKNWWYNSVNQTFSWAGAENWAQFTWYSGRTIYLDNVWKLVWTDILQMDFDQNNNMNHTMFVTKTSSTNIYLTYHTDDHLNRPLTEILDSYPNAWYYAYRT